LHVQHGLRARGRRRGGHGRYRGPRRALGKRVIELARAKGSCTLTAKKLKPGSYRLTGIYGGDRTYDGSAYPAQTLTVTR
jgi:hypothetical protein